MREWYNSQPHLETGTTIRLSLAIITIDVSFIKNGLISLCLSKTSAGQTSSGLSDDRDSADRNYRTIILIVYFPINGQTVWPLIEEIEYGIVPWSDDHYCLWTFAECPHIYINNEALNQPTMLAVQSCHETVWAFGWDRRQWWESQIRCARLCPFNFYSDSTVFIPNHQSVSEYRSVCTDTAPMIIRRTISTTTTKDDDMIVGPETRFHSCDHLAGWLAVWLVGWLTGSQWVLLLYKVTHKTQVTLYWLMVPKKVKVNLCMESQFHELDDNSSSLDRNQPLEVTDGPSHTL